MQEGVKTNNPTQYTSMLKNTTLVRIELPIYIQTGI